MIFIILFLILNQIHRQNESFNFLLIAAINAMLTHHLRDANRHGMWFHPVGSSRAIPTFLYITLTILVPLILSHFVPAITLKYSRLNNFDIFDIWEQKLLMLVKFMWEWIKREKNKIARLWKIYHERVDDEWDTRLSYNLTWLTLTCWQTWMV